MKWFKVVAVPLACFSGLSLSGAEPGTKVDFNRDIRPILSARCLSCHGIDDESRKGELRLDQRADAVRSRDGYHVIKPGDSNASELMARVTSTEADEVMPPPRSGPPLKKEEIEKLRAWIAQGADYAEHWAFLPVSRPQPPETSNDSWASSAIDRFILKKLDQAGLKPAKQADKATLIRRLSLDLTGLPPSVKEVDAYLADSSPDATEKLVQRLLASPHYGERLARGWLDLARYADSKGYGSDPLREYMWRYRDWVIDSFNANKPYDQFLTEQIAGDLIPNATSEQILATSFHRNTMSNDEGGTDDEEFRVAAIKDRVDTTGQVFMGLTVGCAKCHTHKFDPISQKEYYSLFAIFNQTEDNDNPNDEPRLATPTAEQAAKIAAIEGKIKSLASLPLPKGEAFRKELEAWTATIKRSTAWSPARILKAETTSDRTLETGGAGELFAGGKAAKATDTISIQLPAGVTAVRLEALANETEITGPGLAPHGNFVLSSMSGMIDEGKTGLDHVRFVRIELPGNEKMISLAEVEVFRGAENIARKGLASQSSTDFGGQANLAVDGNTSGDFNAGKSVTHTSVSKNPWWELDLKESAGRVDRVKIWNRTDNNLQMRLNGAVVTLLDSARKPVYSAVMQEAPKQNREFAFAGPRPVSFASASSSHDQPGFEVAKSISESARGKNEGWAVGGMKGRTQEAIFRVAGPLPKGELKLKLAQTWGEEHTLGRYNIWVSTEPEPPTALPVAMRDLALGCDCCRTAEDQAKIEEYYWCNIAAENKAARQESEKLQTEKSKLQGQVTRTPILRELPPEKQRKTHVLVKGNYTQFGDAVNPGVPGSFHKLKAAPGQKLNRLDLAQWMTDKANPLTARVAVNRIWAMIFGRGLVETEEDFGTQGRQPSHPELLDYLASEFVNHKWDIRWLVGTIVNTATYRQSSVPDDRTKLAAIDPRNELLSHYPRNRLEAEMIRDQALVISGLFSPRLGGPSVYPPQPDNLWQAAFNGQRTYPTSTGPDRYRRGLYTFWRRTVPNPSMATFDAPSREVCSIRRIGSNTPLQAYVTLNDPVFVEAAQALGRRIIAEGGASIDERLKYGYKLATAREIQPERLAVLRQLYADELKRYEADASAAKLLAESQLGALPAKVTPAEAAAMTVIGNVLLNLDSVLTKG
ncbi:MAG: DUF1553 domain-containing protein [bacterium]